MFLVLRLFGHFLYEKNSQIITKKLPKTNVLKVGHGPEMGQNDFDCACVTVVFPCSARVS